MVNGEMETEVVLVYSIIKMEINTKVHGREIEEMVKEYTDGKVEILLMEIGKMTRCMVTVLK